MPRIHSFHHVPFEGLGHLETIFNREGWPITRTHWYRGENAPTPEAYDALVIMGGPMNIDDEADYPWLADEKRAIARALDAGKPILGICLGAQLLAQALGGGVRPGPGREIGWFELTRQPQADQSPLAGLLPERFEVFHWHGDQIEPPPGAQLLASSEACRWQIFSYGENVLGLQCHLETTPDTARALIEHCADELDGSTWVQTADTMLADRERFDRINRLAEALVQRWLNGQ